MKMNTLPTKNTIDGVEVRIQAGSTFYVSGNRTNGCLNQGWGRNYLDFGYVRKIGIRIKNFNVAELWGHLNISLIVSAISPAHHHQPMSSRLFGLNAAYLRFLHAATGLNVVIGRTGLDQRRAVQAGIQIALHFARAHLRF